MNATLILKTLRNLRNLRKAWRRIALHLACLAAVTALCACTPPSADVIAGKALDNVLRIHNLEAESIFRLDVARDEKRMSAVAEGTLVFHTKPMMLEQNHVIKASDEEAVETQAFALENDKAAFESALYFRQAAQGTLGDAVWHKLGYDFAIEYGNVKANLEQLFKSAALSLDGEESIGGKACYKLSGTLSGEAAEQNAAFAIDMIMTYMNMPYEFYSALYDGTCVLPVTVWVEKATYTPAKFSLDMTQLLDAFVQKTSGDLNVGVSASACAFEMTLKNIGSAREIHVPDEAFEVSVS